MLVNWEIIKKWNSTLSNEIAQPYFDSLISFLKQETEAGKIIFPPAIDVLTAFEQTPFEALKVVILGQDPYHAKGQAHGLCFSVNKDIKIPPSLQNIYKSIQFDIPTFAIPTHGNLSAWAKQGVLLLNTTLTVEDAKPGSHQGKGWEQFTDSIIKNISAQKEHVVFILWGSFAQSKTPLINESKHLILKSVHPSPLSAYRGFLTCKHFSKTNEYLASWGLSKINWQV